MSGDDPLTGRTALVSGGGNGLGAAIARTLDAAGIRVIITGRALEKLTRVAAELGGRPRVETVDVSDPVQVEELAERLSDERIDVLVNNAGIAGPVAPLIEIEPEQWDEVFDINVRGTYLMCRAFLPPMIERGTGDVINIASVSGKRPLIRRTPYCASKMAVIGLTQTLAFEVGPSGVRVNTLSPGPVEGERMDRNFRMEGERTGAGSEAAREAFVSRAALGRMVTEQEVAQAVLAMLQLPGMTGADVDLSGGMVA
ncbi:NADP-dependent 3-hydroxy acid dehydrogenase YdfG [Propionibacteriaceae bacterium ES.041]|uniref:SDR family NAD(P)-dependent oxidoreductase n=1 Tax=Enemella evansiae TaxID=2016499 RepID=UPI000B964C46|nr:SDR family NAD(P)-dependent oxidoreductase [Enemella evansiae]OYO10850.1 oxidoreductase [Enemella evansiae]PFG65743.1 NADP-dependent 3-hydroxy acid dehydrogenase YdfG [Propionibacteriaceae bacterium ES.041]